MTENKNPKILLDATSGIKEEYIEEAAAFRRARPAWVSFAAVAAVLAILLGVAVKWQLTSPIIGSMPPTSGPDLPTGGFVPPVSEPVTLFALRAFAQDGTLAALENPGDSSKLAAQTNVLFPGKEVFTLDISLSNADGKRVDPVDYNVECFHRGSYLQPGQSSEYISIVWLEKDDFCGYRIVGWCEMPEYVDITIRDHSGLILYQKSMLIEFSEQYSASVYTSYVYEKDLPTQALIEKLFYTEQEYDMKANLLVMPYEDEEYQHLLSRCGGFAELEQRSDAASVLLQCLVEMIERGPVAHPAVEYYGVLGWVLSLDVYWEKLTEEELALIESYGLTRKGEPRDPAAFQQWEKFHHQVLLGDKYKPEYTLTVDYEGRTEQHQKEHLLIGKAGMGSGAEWRIIGWAIYGWFEKPTVLTLTVMDGEGNAVYQQRVLITPTEEGRQIVTGLDYQWIE